MSVCVFECVSVYLSVFLCVSVCVQCLRGVRCGAALFLGSTWPNFHCPLASCSLQMEQQLFPTASEEDVWGLGIQKHYWLVTSGQESHGA